VERRAPRSALNVAVAAMAGTLIGAGPVIGVGPVSADVAVTPDQAVQGESARLTFMVTDDRPGAYTTRIELRLPDDAPVAETWPMSVSDWAPLITMRPVDGALPGLHHGEVTEVVSAITWIRAEATGTEPKPAELSISLGPMPPIDRMTFTVVQTYSDGFVATWGEEPIANGTRPEFPAAIVRLEPAAGAAGAGAAGPGTAAVEPADGSTDGGLGLLDAGLAAGLLVVLGLAGWFLFRNRRGVAELSADSTTEPTTSDDTTGADRTTGAKTPETANAAAGPAPGAPSDPGAGLSSTPR
jgi:uncharacterized protein YcnI